AACARDEVRSPAAATSTATPSGDARPSSAPTTATKPEPPTEQPAPPTEERPTEAQVAKQLPAARVVTLAPEGGELSDQLAPAAPRGKAGGLVPVVEMWAGWCPPCKKLDRLLDDPAFADSLRGLALVRLDSDAWGEALDSAGFDAPSIPTFYALDA